MGVGAAIAGSAALSAGASILGSSNAASAQTAAAQQASNTQLAMFDQTQANLQPYMNSGAAAQNALAYYTGLRPAAGQTTTDTAAYDQAMQQWQASQQPQPAQNGNALYLSGMIDNAQSNHSGVDLSSQGYTWNPATATWTPPSGGQSAMPQIGQYQTTTGGNPGYTDNPLASPLLAPITMNEAQLQQTPGYQFNLYQGEKSVQNAAAARGLGASGAALKGAANYATGLADSTYQNQFSNAVTNQTNAFNRLYSMANSGQNAAAGLGGIGQQTAANIGNNLTGAGNAVAASYTNMANGIGNAASSIPGGILTNNLVQGMYGNINDNLVNSGMLLTSFNK